MKGIKRVIAFILLVSILSTVFGLSRLLFDYPKWGIVVAMIATLLIAWESSNENSIHSLVKYIIVLALLSFIGYLFGIPLNDFT